VGLVDILRVGDTIDLRDGLHPAERAERTLRLFLGETLYAQLETQHFLDVSSVHYAELNLPQFYIQTRSTGRFFNKFCGYQFGIRNHSAIPMKTWRRCTQPFTVTCSFSNLSCLAIVLMAGIQYMLK
jgi:hypothetical protein